MLWKSVIELRKKSLDTKMVLDGITSVGSVVADTNSDNGMLVALREALSIILGELLGWILEILIEASNEVAKGGEVDRISVIVLGD